MIPICGKWQFFGWQYTTEGGQQIKSVALGVKARIGHLRDPADPDFIESPDGAFKIFAPTALDRIAAQTACHDRMA